MACMGRVDLRAPDHAAAAGLGALRRAFVVARRRGRFHGGNLRAQREH